MGTAQNNSKLPRLLEGEILEDEEGNEDDVQSDASEESSDGEGDEEMAEGAFEYPLPSDWCDEMVEDCEPIPNVPTEAAELLAGIPPFTPFNGNVGSIFDLSEVIADSTWSHFRLFYPDVIFDRFITATNAVGQLHRGATWKPVTLSEFKGFLACVLHLGIVTYPNRRMAWSTGPEGSQVLRRIMSRERFDSILHYWRFLDISLYSNEELNELKKADPFWAVTEYCNLLSDQFEGLWSPSQFLDIDEQTIPFKGRHKCRCYGTQNGKTGRQYVCYILFQPIEDNVSEM